MNTKVIRYVLYTIIVIICIVSIGIAVYVQFFGEETATGGYENDIIGGGAENSDYGYGYGVKQEFLDLFTNEFYSNQYAGQINKVDPSQDIVYTAYSNAQVVDGKYDIDVNIPYINIQGDVVAGYNNISQTVFADKISSVIAGTNVYTIYNLSYTAYINNDILSVAIMATIKEGDNPQRIMVQTYNYNLATGQNVGIRDILNNRGIEESVVENRIKTRISQESDNAAQMAEAGYQVYQRNPEDEMYKIDNIQTFIQGPNGELYIVFAYGNNNYTSEMDVVEI